jgi:hypothetical protein
MGYTMRRYAFVLVIGLAAAVQLRADETLRIVPIVRDNKLFVSFELEGAYSDAVHDAIASGLKTTFTYELELRTAAWIDRTIATTTVATSDQYDNLTRRHTLSRLIDGRVEEVTVTEDEAVVTAWLTKWTRVPVYDATRLDPARDYYVRVTSRARPLGGSLLGLTRTISSKVKFTAIP